MNAASSHGRSPASIWQDLAESGDIPLVKILEAGTDSRGASLQFRHLSLQEALAAAELSASTSTKRKHVWDDDASAVVYLNDPFNINTLRVGGRVLGGKLAQKRSVWDLSPGPRGPLKVPALKVDPGATNLQSLLQGDNLSLKNLTLSQVPLGVVLGEAIGVAALTSCPQLEVLALQCVQLCEDDEGPSSDAVVAIAGHLATHASIRVVDLQGNHVDERARAVEALEGVQLRRAEAELTELRMPHMRE